MKAVGIRRFGDADVLELIDVREPHAGPGQVRIRVAAAAVNPVDVVTRAGQGRGRPRGAGGRPDPEGAPYVLGWDAAGVVDELGAGAPEDLAIGDHVMAVTAPIGETGAYAEYLVVPAQSVVPAPTGWSDLESCTLPMNGLTARLTLDLLALPPGATLAVTGAAGTFGGYTIELARAEGMRVIADAYAADRELVAHLGANVVVARGPDVAARILDVVPEGVDAVADGAVLDELVTPAVRYGGRIATLRGYTGAATRRISWHPVWVRKYLRQREQLDRLRRQAEAGVLKPRIAEVLPMRRAAEAHRRLEAGGIRGRLVLAF